MKPNALSVSIIMVFCLLSGIARAGALDAVIEKRVIQLGAAQVPAARGKPIDALSLVRWQSGEQRFVPVPYQIDELGEARMVWFEASGLGPKGEPGLFDEQDEIVVLFSDAGARAPSSAALGQGEIVSELRLKHPADGADRFLYLAQGHEARSDKRYIEHNLETGVTRTPWYRLEVDPGNELNWLFLGYAGYEGQGSIIDTLKMRMAAGVFTRFARVTLDNDNLDPSVRGHKVGPIRSIMHLETRVVLAGIPVMKMHVQAYRYPHHYEAHTFANIPFIYRATLKDPSVSVAVDGHRQEGATVRTARSGDLEGKVDGKMSKTEEKIKKRGLSTDENWILFDTHRGFSLLTLLDMPPELSGIPLGLVYQDDADAAVKPEKHVGQWPLLGYALEGWPPKSEMRFAVKMFFADTAPDMPPTQYAGLRTDVGDWVTSQAWAAE